MAKSQLPLLTSAMMLTQALLAAPAGIRAKTSLKARNNVLLLGFLAMIGADLAFAFIGSVPGLISLHALKAEHCCVLLLAIPGYLAVLPGMILSPADTLQHPVFYLHGVQRAGLLQVCSWEQHWLESTWR